jgi:hypothetical protein
LKNTSTPASPCATHMSTPRTPTTRKRKSRLVEEVTKRVIDMNLSKNEQIEVLRGTLINLGILNEFQNKPTKAGRKSLSLETRKQVWDFWHNSVCSVSTCTTRPAKLKKENRPNIQNGLEFVSTKKLPYDTYSFSLK